MKRIVHVVVGFALLSALGCAQGPRALTDEDVAAIRELFEAVPRYINAGDYASFVNETFTERALFMPPNDELVTGRAAIQAWAEENPATNVSFSNIEIRGSGDLAWGHSAYSLEAEGLPAPDVGKQLVVLVRQGEGAGRWWVVAVSFNSDLPLPEMGTP